MLKNLHYFVKTMIYIFIYIYYFIDFIYIIRGRVTEQSEGSECISHPFYAHSMLIQSILIPKLYGEVKSTYVGVLQQSTVELDLTFS